MRNKFIAMLFAALLCFTGATVHAQSADTITVTPQPSASRTISTAGSGHVVDNITDTDSEKIQFITVTAKDGSVFYVVIDKQNSNDNVYFLNSVDVSDLEALTEDYKPKAAAVSTPSPSVTPTSSEDKGGAAAEKKDTAKKSGGINSGAVIVILVLAAVGIGGGYYVKVILPKKKLEDADDLEDFDFEDEDESDSEDSGADEYNEDEE